MTGSIFSLIWTLKDCQRKNFGSVLRACVKDVLFWLVILSLKLKRRKSMRGLSKVNNNGTGESRLSKEHKVRMVNLNNSPVTLSKINAFFKINNLRPSHVNLSDRSTKCRWGTAWHTQNRLILYRHSEGVFIHELAHIHAYRKYSVNCKHDTVFTSVLEKLMDMWETTPF